MKCSGRSQEAKVTWGWGVWGGREDLGQPPTPFSVKLALSTGLEDQVGIRCMELWGKGFPGRGDSVGKGMELGKCEVCLGTAGSSVVGVWS